MLKYTNIFFIVFFFFFGGVGVPVLLLHDSQYCRELHSDLLSVLFHLQVCSPLVPDQQLKMKVKR